MQLLNSIKRTRKNWKYVNSKTKHIEKIGDLKKKNKQGDTVICSLAKRLK